MNSFLNCGLDCCDIVPFQSQSKYMLFSKNGEMETSFFYFCQLFQRDEEKNWSCKNNSELISYDLQNDIALFPSKDALARKLEEGFTVYQDKYDLISLGYIREIISFKCSTLSFSAWIHDSTPRKCLSTHFILSW